MSARKFSQEEVKDIRWKVNRGLSFREIAQEYGVSRVHLGRVAKGRNYTEFNELYPPQKSKHYKKAKLAPVQVKELREEYKLVKDDLYFSESKFKKAMATKFKVSPQIIYSILKGYSYRGVK